MRANHHRRPVSVLVVVYTEDCQVLLLRRREPFDFWQSVTGSLREGEVPADAAVRELFEETGLTGEGELVDRGITRTFVIDPRWRERFAPGITTNLEYEWCYRVPEAIDIQLNTDEHSEYVWLPITEAVDKVWSWTNRDALLGLLHHR